MIPPGTHPLDLIAELWPHVRLYREQRDMVESVWANDETVVVAGNKLGKDYTAGLICVAFFISRHPCRIVTTSAKADHLRVLWSEIDAFVQSCKYPLDHKRGGPLIVHHQDVRKMHAGKRCPTSYMIGMVAAPDSIAAMQGHHVANVGDGIPRTLFVADESSSVADEYRKMARTWYNRALIIGNPWACNNFFYRAVKGDAAKNDPGGDLPSPDGRYERRVFHIAAEQSPNVRLALAQIAAGKEPTNEVLVPGVKAYPEYEKDRRTLDPEEQCVTLDARFYEGPSLKLYPPDVLAASGRIALSLVGRKRQAKAVGVDPGEGGAETALYAVDELGVLDELALPTPDTSDIPTMILDFLARNGVPDHMCLMDRGGGGKQAYDQLRKMGRTVRTLAFGGPPVEGRKEPGVTRAAYLNVRAQLYGELSDLVRAGFAIPLGMAELRRQLAPVPKLRDGEGRLWLPPKNRRTPGGKEVTMTQLVGCSPDRADALCLAVHALLHPERQRSKAGAWGV